MKKKKTIHDLALHESLVVKNESTNESIIVLRVYKGWIYSFYNGTTNDYDNKLFVPDDDE